MGTISPEPPGQACLSLGPVCAAFRTWLLQPALLMCGNNSRDPVCPASLSKPAFAWVSFQPA